MKQALHISTIAIMLLSGSAIAQDEKATDEQPAQATTQQRIGDPSTVAGAALGPPASAHRVTLRGGYRLQFESDFDSAPGDFSVNRALIGVNVAGVINDETSYSLDFQAEHSSYDFSAASGLAPGSDDPLDASLSFIFSPSFRYAVNEDWAVRAGAALIASGESDADVGESLRWSLFGGVEHKFSDNLTMSLILVAWTRLEDNTTIFPLIGVSWQINELMRLQTRGLGAEFISDLGNGWSLGARAAWEYREFRLTDESSAPLPEGVLRDSGVITSLELAYQPSADVVLAIEAGGVVAQELEFLDRGGSSISQTDADPALFVGVRASISF